MKLVQAIAAALAGVGGAWAAGKVLAKTVKETVAPGETTSATTADTTSPVETTGTTVEEKKEETE